MSDLLKLAQFELEKNTIAWRAAEYAAKKKKTDSLREKGIAALRAFLPSDQIWKIDVGEPVYVEGGHFGGTYQGIELIVDGIHFAYAVGKRSSTPATGNTRPFVKTSLFSAPHARDAAPQTGRGEPMSSRTSRPPTLPTTSAGRAGRKSGRSLRWRKPRSRSRIPTDAGSRSPGTAKSEAAAPNVYHRDRMTNSLHLYERT